MLIQLWRKYRFLVWLGVLLLSGFVATSVMGYWVSRDQLRHNITDQGLPLTGDNIYSEIQKDVMRPTFLASLMAYDTFVRDWLLAGEVDQAQIVRYLKEVKDKYGAVSSFLVSEKTGNYYYGKGVLKKVAAGDPHDQWYFSMRHLVEPFRMDLDVDQANQDTLTLFINYKLLDYQGNFIGVTGLGLTLDSLALVIEDMQKRFARSIYFVDAQGEIIVTARSGALRSGSIHRLSGIDQIATRIINGNPHPVQLEYEDAGQRILLSSRYIPEFKWYLVVEQSEDEAMRPLRNAFMLNLAISALVTFGVLVLCLYSVNRYRRRLEAVAATDPLTGLLNRYAFELVFNQSAHEIQRARGSMAMILVDIDHFKCINDEHGHLAGDRVISRVGKVLRKGLRASDILCRWGGEEFLILLKQASLADAVQVAEKLRLLLADEEFQLGQSSIKITGSFGVSEYADGESLVHFFARADGALYSAKEAGRNQVVSR